MSVAVAIASKHNAGCDVPSGLTGPQLVVIKQATATSNTVTIPVQ